MSQLDYRNIGFIGLGAMGKPMVKNLISKLPSETRVYIYDINDSAIEETLQENSSQVFRGENAKDVASKCEVVLTMVPEGSHVKSAYLTPNTGICEADLNNKLLIDCSTIDTATNLHIKQHITSTFPSAAFYDAPVSGGVIGAEKGTLAFFLGCHETDPNATKLHDLLSLMGKQIIPCGEPSHGLAAKLSNNYLSGLIAIATSEALDMGMRSGLSPVVLSKVYAAGTAQNTICDRFNPCPGVYAEAPSSRGYKGGFKIQLMKKDFGLAVEMAERVGARNVLGEVGLRTYKLASEDERCKDLDSRVVYRYLGGNEEWQKDVD